MDFLSILKVVFQKMANLWHNTIDLLPKKVGRYFGKQRFLAIFVKFGTSGNPTLRRGPTGVITAV